MRKLFLLGCEMAFLDRDTMWHAKLYRLDPLRCRLLGDAELCLHQIVGHGFVVRFVSMVMLSSLVLDSCSAYPAHYSSYSPSYP